LHEHATTPEDSIKSRSADSFLSRSSAHRIQRALAVVILARVQSIPIDARASAAFSDAAIASAYAFAALDTSIICSTRRLILTSRSTSDGNLRCNYRKRSRIDGVLVRKESLAAASNVPDVVVIVIGVFGAKNERVSELVQNGKHLHSIENSVALFRALADRRGRGS
jgi:hypothetical protein